MVTAALEQAPPGGDTHWSTRTVARQAGVSQSTVSRIWQALGLKPHVSQTWKLSTDPQFIDKACDVVGFYMARRSTPGCCAWTRRASSSPGPDCPDPAHGAHDPAWIAQDYVRNGSTRLFAAYDLATGSVIA